MRIYSMKVNGLSEPVGFAYDRVLVSWKVEDTDARSLVNATVEVSENENFENIILSQSGILDSKETELKLDLKLRTTYYWRVMVEGDNGEKAAGQASFETGKMEEAWQAKWIGPHKEDTFHPVLVKEFDSTKAIKRARIYVCGLGLYEVYINGSKTGNEYLAPFMNDYKTGYQYETYDIKPQLENHNTVEIILGKGWYMGVFGLGLTENNYGDRMMAIAELHLEYEDGTSQVIATDESWSYKGSDIEESGIYFGEIYNHTLWESKENPLRPVELVEAPGKLMERYSMPVVEKECLEAAEIIHTPAGETVIDFGQNHSGLIEFEADWEKGTKVTFECGEILQEGNFYHDNYREAESKFVYVSDGRKETVRPHFTYYGFRYLKVTGWPGELKKGDVKAPVIYSDLDRTGYIETSNEKINRLYANCLWGQKSNFVDMPTDCPQRSERLGWTGDIQVFTPTASLNMDTRAFMNKFFKDLRYDQLRNNGGIGNYIPAIGDLAGCSSIWGDVGTFSTTEIYKTFGNLKQMEAYYPMMKDWVEYMHRIDVEKGDKGFFLNVMQFGDWLALDGVTEQSFKGSTDDDYLGTVYYYQSTKLTKEMAQRLGYEEDARKYAQLEEKIKKAIFSEYFTPSGRLAMDTQASYIVALKFGLYIDKDKLINQFKERLKKDCYEIKCGFVGAPLLCITLCENGMTDLAYQFLFKETFPSWLYCVNLGATTIWERWNSLLPDGTCSGTGMNSFNHYAYGSVVQFFYQYIAGIRELEPGYSKAVIAPEPSMKFRHFNCSYDSASGKYVSNWKIAEDGSFSLHVEVPFNCTAEIVLPRCKGENVKTSESVAIDAQGRCTVAAGCYDFEYMPTNDYRKVYSEKTRLGQLTEDAEAMEILQKELPNAFGMAMNGDKEDLNLTFEDLKFMFFAGFNPEVVAKAGEKIYNLIRW